MQNWENIKASKYRHMTEREEQSFSGGAGVVVVYFSDKKNRKSVAKKHILKRYILNFHQFSRSGLHSQSHYSTTRQGSHFRGQLVLKARPCHLGALKFDHPLL